MRIGALARTTGVTTKTIRYYEDIGVLPRPARAPNGYREYDAEAVERLRFVKDAQATGLTLGEIAAILELRGQGATTCDHVVALLEHHLDDLDAHIARLSAARRELTAMIERARELDPADCTDPRRCQTISAADGPARGQELHHALRAHRH